MDPNTPNTTAYIQQGDQWIPVNISDPQQQQQMQQVQHQQQQQHDILVDPNLFFGLQGVQHVGATVTPAPNATTAPVLFMHDGVAAPLSSNPQQQQQQQFQVFNSSAGVFELIPQLENALITSDPSQLVAPKPQFSSAAGLSTQQHEQLIQQQQQQQLLQQRQKFQLQQQQQHQPHEYFQQQLQPAFLQQDPHSLIGFADSQHDSSESANNFLRGPLQSLTKPVDHVNQSRTPRLNSMQPSTHINPSQARQHHSGNRRSLHQSTIPAGPPASSGALYTLPPAPANSQQLYPQYYQQQQQRQQQPQYHAMVPSASDTETVDYNLPSVRRAMQPPTISKVSRLGKGLGNQRFSAALSQILPQESLRILNHTFEFESYPEGPSDEVADGEEESEGDESTSHGSSPHSTRSNSSSSSSTRKPDLKHPLDQQQDEPSKSKVPFPLVTPKNKRISMSKLKRGGQSSLEFIFEFPAKPQLHLHPDQLQDPPSSTTVTTASTSVVTTTTTTTVMKPHGKGSSKHSSKHRKSPKSSAGEPSSSSGTNSGMLKVRFNHNHPFKQQMQQRLREFNAQQTTDSTTAALPSTSSSSSREGRQKKKSNSERESIDYSRTQKQ